MHVATCRTIAAAVACGVYAALGASLTEARPQAPTDAAHAAAVERAGTAVMPFDLDRTMHVFEPRRDGGVQTVTVMDRDQHQVMLVRAHLKKEAAAFARGDFSDPAHIHGAAMPGLAELRAGSNRLTVTYSAVQDGGRIRYATADPQLVAAIHRWFAAQTRDHAHHAMMR